MEKWEYLHQYIAIIGDDLDATLPVEEFCKTGKTQRWEVILEDELQKYGDQGWELVSIDPSLISGNGVDGYALFKRRKVE